VGQKSFDTGGDMLHIECHMTCGPHSIFLLVKA